MQDKRAGWIFILRQMNKNSGDYGAVARVILDGRLVERIHKKIVLKDTRKLMVMFRIFSGEQYQKMFQIFVEELSVILKDFWIHKKQHMKEYQRVYDTCDLSLMGK